MNKFVDQEDSFLQSATALRNTIRLKECTIIYIPFQTAQFLRCNACCLWGGEKLGP
jgi:hypothetical protein